jgi:site-specific DNA recombinase
MDKLLDAYQEGLITIAQLRIRMPELQRRLKAIEKELENLKHHELTLDQRLQYLDAQSFASQLGVNIDSLNIKEKKKILRLLVKEVVVGDDLIDIRHSIPLKETKNEQNKKNYQLCKRTDRTSLRNAFSSLDQFPFY